MTKEKALTIQQEVKFVLENEKRTRSDDLLLWACILADRNIVSPEEFTMLINLSTKTMGVTYESVSRARRKVQADNPTLCDARTRAARQQEENDYHEIYRHEGGRH